MYFIDCFISSGFSGQLRTCNKIPLWNGPLRLQTRDQINTVSITVPLTQNETKPSTPQVLNRPTEQVCEHFRDSAAANLSSLSSMCNV